MQDRAALYGDGVFEAIKISNGKPLFTNLHFLRIKFGANVLNIHCDILENEDAFINEIKNYLIKHAIVNAKLRLSISRMGNVGYASNSTKAIVSIIHQNIEIPNYELNNISWTHGIYTKQTKALGELMHIKSLSALIYVQAANYALQNNFDECFVLNTNQEIIEGFKSNVFFINTQTNTLYTPPLQSGCLPGVLRQLIFEIAKEKKINCLEKIIFTSQLDYQTILFTNAIQGIKWAGKKSPLVQLFIDELNKKVGQI